MLLYRGYGRRAKGDGRLYFETRLNIRKKIIFRKYYFRKEKGIILYIPLYEEETEKEVRKRLKENEFPYEVWKEERVEVGGMEVLGIDLRQDIELALEVFYWVMDIVFLREEVENIFIYFKNIAELREEYDFDIEKEERDEEIRKRLEVPVSWAANLGNILGTVVRKILFLGK